MFIDFILPLIPFLCLASSLSVLTDYDTYDANELAKLLHHYHKNYDDEVDAISDGPWKKKDAISTLSKKSTVCVDIDTMYVNQFLFDLAKLRPVYSLDFDVNESYGKKPAIELLKVFCSKNPSLVNEVSDVLSYLNRNFAEIVAIYELLTSNHQVPFSGKILRAYDKLRKSNRVVTSLLRMFGEASSMMKEKIWKGKPGYNDDKIAWSYYDESMN